MSVNSQQQNIINFKNGINGLTKSMIVTINLDLKNQLKDINNATTKF